MNNQPISKKININKLIVNPKNYRFNNPVIGERAAMKELFEVRGRDKMFNLIKHVIKHGINPTKRVSVIRFQDNKYTLLDGNRRVTTLKLINDLSLIEDSGIQNRIKELAKGRTVQNTIDCVVFDSRKDAELWIELEHRAKQDGVGTLLWDIEEREKLRTNYPAARQIKSVFMERKDIYKENKVKIKKYSPSNVERLINNIRIRNYLGLEIKKGQIYNFYQEDKQDKILRLINYLIENKITSRDINSAEQQLNTVKKALSCPIQEDECEEEDFTEEENSSTEETGNTNTTNTTPYKQRTKLVPEDLNLDIPRRKYPRVGNFFDELKTINLRGENLVNVSSFAFRVFVEFSMNCYMESNGLLKDGKLTAVKGISLQEKITTVANNLKQKKEVDDAMCQEILNQAKQKNGLFSPDTLNAYVHNHKFSPTSTSLINMWDNIEDFICKLWENVN